MTFVDVTDSVQVERALKDKNEALRRADQLKNDFVQHVSYELRSPLTNIIGFTELLALGTTGPLLPRQREYIEHIGSSSAVLLTIVNDILDLATVDAGIMELEIGEVAVDSTIEAAAELVADRLEEHAITLAIETSHRAQDLPWRRDPHPPDPLQSPVQCRELCPRGQHHNTDLRAPARRRRIRGARRRSGHGARGSRRWCLRRFEPRSNGGRRRGAGLGLSIVKSFVELHGGAVHIETGAGAGTTVSCMFPLAPAGVRAAAECRNRIQERVQQERRYGGREHSHAAGNHRLLAVCPAYQGQRCAGGIHLPARWPAQPGVHQGLQRKRPGHRPAFSFLARQRRTNTTCPSSVMQHWA